MSNPNNAGEKRGDSGGKGGGNRRRYFRRRKPSAPKAQPESAPKAPPRKAAEPPPKGRPRTNARNEGSNAGKNDRDRRGGGGRRRRRRSRSERPDETPVVRESTLATIDQEYKPPKSVFVYTYVLRPGAPTSYEFRAEHFSRVGRRLEDFEIDLSPLFPAEGQPRPEFSRRPPLAQDEEETSEFSDQLNDSANDFDDDFDQIDDQEEGVKP
jgi:hypothetical protein